MKFDTYLANFFYQNKKLSLEAIGNFTLTETIAIANDASNGIHYPTDGIVFECDKKTKASDELIAFIKLESRKPVSLIASDLQEYTLQITNWLNMGKPYTIEGIGTLIKLQSGQYEFSYGGNKLENIAGIGASFTKSESSINKPANKKNIDVSKFVKPLVIICISLVVIAAAWFGFTYFKSTNKKNTTTIGSIPPVTTVTNDTMVKPIPKDSLVSPIVSGNDTVRYKMFFLASKYREKADKLYAIWSKGNPINRDSLVINDTLRHRLFIYRRLLSIDTTKVKLELAKYFNHAITMEVGN